MNKFVLNVRRARDKFPITPGTIPEPSPAGGQWCPTPGCCIHPILYFLNVSHPFWFLAPPAAKSWRRACTIRRNKLFLVKFRYHLYCVSIITRPQDSHNAALVLLLVRVSPSEEFEFDTLVYFRNKKDFETGLLLNHSLSFKAYKM